jgi:hypothetical protein
MPYHVAILHAPDIERLLTQWLMQTPGPTEHGRYSTAKSMKLDDYPNTTADPPKYENSTPHGQLNYGQHECARIGRSSLAIATRALHHHSL